MRYQIGSETFEIGHEIERLIFVMAIATKRPIGIVVRDVLDQASFLVGPKGYRVLMHGIDAGTEKMREELTREFVLTLQDDVAAARSVAEQVSKNEIRSMW
jgi:hypothetical protein